MGLLPENHAARIAWFQSRESLWTTNATAIGTTSAAVTDVAAKATAAADALAAQEVAHNAAKASTATLINAMDALTNAGMAVVEQVRTKARSAGPGVFPLANIPGPAIPTPVGAPGTPSDLVAELLPGGAVSLTWKANNPPGCKGVIYQVGRQDDQAGEFKYLGGSGERKFIDATIPAGTSTCIYRIQGVRTTAVGNIQEFVVRFGAASGNGANSLSVEARPVKLAA